ncbi:TorD/DmsD family molecular chaperone [Adlercreutzia caecimuris]|uniref:TorD/DmsD family molecular chaperone n=1 Tax=Adlercreutzia caecimuris TaxID=671266 RepID=UPI00272B7641|nr:molecular chaperone TorD family protein [Adlercreutzia caecimuris]
MNIDKLNKCDYENFAAAYRFLSSAVFAELDRSQIEALRDKCLPAVDGSGMQKASREISRYLKRSDDTIETKLRVDFARVFLAAGIYEKGDSPAPYESVFTSPKGIMMQEARDDAVKRYAEVGMVVSKDLNEPEDHLAFELEYMAILHDRMAKVAEESDEEELVALKEKASSFAANHLLNWVGLLQKRVTKYSKEPFYPALLEYTLGLVEENVAMLASDS